ncbi:MAG TPA: hypothetical protein VLX56_03815 [Nitrososphaerales archaeon]|nr:hypothetical protein [Nitrososphaerales archaeon]
MIQWDIVDMSAREAVQGMKSAVAEETLERLRQDLEGPFDLSLDREPETQYFHMQTQFIHMGFDGRRTGVETYLLRLRCTPAAISGKKLDEYTCREFGLQLNDNAVTTIPALRLLTYQFDQMSGILGKGPMFGIPQEPFGGMKDSLGNQLPPDICYATYNNFVDFHALGDVFSRPMKYVKGVEELKSIGDRIVHPGAFTEAPVSLTGVVRPGSVFRNGELTLELKGVSLVDDCPCALVNYDSGESTLRMAFIQGGNSEDVTMEGGSEYTGDIHIDLASGWVRKVTLNESVVTQTYTASRPNKILGYTVRHILLRLISQQDFEKPISILS